MRMFVTAQFTVLFQSINNIIFFPFKYFKFAYTILTRNSTGMAEWLS